MWWMTAALAGNLPSQLDRSVQRWMDGAAPSAAFGDVLVRSDGGLRSKLEAQGVDHLEFAGMEVELALQVRGEPRMLRLFLDPRKPGRPIVRNVEVVEATSGAHPLKAWGAKNRHAAKLGNKVFAGLLDSSCPQGWRPATLPAGTPAVVVESLDPGRIRAESKGQEACDLVLDSTLVGLKLDDVAWFAFDAADQPLGMLRGELVLGREKLEFRFNGLRVFPR